MCPKYSETEYQLACSAVAPLKSLELQHEMSAEHLSSDFSFLISPDTNIHFAYA